uniref:Uncharacterized protein n=1 Tax=Aegilops tauschii subsp. strangulata TaxID=200361 RepID=A0A453M4F8_AEGTS
MSVSRYHRPRRPYRLQCGSGSHDPAPCATGQRMNRKRSQCRRQDENGSQLFAIRRKREEKGGYLQLGEPGLRLGLGRRGRRVVRRRRGRLGLGGPVVRLVGGGGGPELGRGRRVRREGGGGRRRGLLGRGRGRAGGEHLHDLDVPEHPVLGGGAVRHVVGDGVAPGRDAPVGAEVLVPAPADAAGAGLEAHLEAVADGLPLDGRVGAAPGRRGRLQHLAARHAQQERLRGGGQVAAVPAAEAHRAGRVRHGLHRPARARGGAVAVLRDVQLVLVRVQELVVPALQPHRLGVREQLH